MANVQESNNSLGIRLFGATISVKPIRSQEETKKGEDDPRVDKIIPCPRCKSMETKFCYFNNYNANQPRHFCKGCQRYWTAGGALRDVPFGAGHRKAKPPCPASLEAGCLFDATLARVQQLDFEHFFPAKRRRCSAPIDSKTC